MDLEARLAAGEFQALQREDVGVEIVVGGEGQAVHGGFAVEEIGDRQAAIGDAEFGAPAGEEAVGPAAQAEAARDLARDAVGVDREALEFEEVLGAVIGGGDEGAADLERNVREGADLEQPRPGRDRALARLQRAADADDQTERAAHRQRRALKLLEERAGVGERIQIGVDDAGVDDDVRRAALVGGVAVEAPIALGQRYLSVERGREAVGGAADDQRAARRLDDGVARLVDEGHRRVAEGDFGEVGFLLALDRRLQQFLDEGGGVGFGRLDLPGAPDFGADADVVAAVGEAHEGRGRADDGEAARRDVARQQRADGKADRDVVGGGDLDAVVVDQARVDEAHDQTGFRRRPDQQRVAGRKAVARHGVGDRADQQRSERSQRDRAEGEADAERPQRPDDQNRDAGGQMRQPAAKRRAAAPAPRRGRLGRRWQGVGHAAVDPVGPAPLWRTAAGCSISADAAIGA